MEAGVGGLNPEDMEVLGEKAFPEGHVDLLIKEAVRKGISRKVVLEVKAGAATRKNIEQIRYYMQVLGEECVGGVLIARSFSPRLRDVIGEPIVGASEFGLELPNTPIPFSEVVNRLTLAPA